MLKLSRHLFSHTADVKYADYYEKALYNHILGQQDPETGMIAYFLPMLPGAHKVYSTADSSFWCCVGSGFENQAKYGEAIYYHTEKEVYVNLFIASELDWKEKGLKLKQETTFPETGKMKFSILQSPALPMGLQIRYPSWAVNGAVLKVNGKVQPVKQKPGSYLLISRKWKVGDNVELDFPMSLHTVATNDDPDVAAIVYGPIVLAGEMGTAGMKSPAPFSDPKLYNDYYTYDYKVPSGIVTSLTLKKDNLNIAVQPVAGKPLTFRTLKEGVLLRPLYDIHQQRYVVYWKLK